MGVLEAVLYRKVHYSGVPAFDRGCDGKIPHSSEVSARRHAKRMKKIMKKAVDTVYKLLWLKQNDPEKYEMTLAFGNRYTRFWDEPKTDVG